MRDLASVVTIDKTWRLEGKDRVHGVSFKELGFEAMVSIDIKEGDLVAFIQEGSLLPAMVEEDPANPGQMVHTGTWAFLERMKCYKESENAYLIKVKKFKEIKSWGLCLKLTELGLDEKTVKGLKAGDDLTELLKIRKYEPAEDASPKKGESKNAYPKWVKFCLHHRLTRWIGRIWQSKHQNSAGGFPTDIISKSDETQIQNYKLALTKFAESKVYTSIKMEGQSFTALYKMQGDKAKYFYVCSRNNAYTAVCNNDFWSAAKDYGIKDKLLDYYKKTGKMLVIQGEQCGPGIQQNIYHFDKLRWFVYSMKDQLTGKQLSLPEMVEACKELGLETVPIIESDVVLKDIMPDIHTAEAYAESKYFKVDGGKLVSVYTPKENETLWVDFAQNEGVVVRSMDYDKDSNIGVSFKVKNIDYQEKGLGKIAAMF